LSGLNNHRALDIITKIRVFSDIVIKKAEKEASSCDVKNAGGYGSPLL
jgi:hypothetical protein